MNARSLSTNARAAKSRKADESKNSIFEAASNSTIPPFQKPIDSEWSTGKTPVLSTVLTEARKGWTPPVGDPLHAEASAAWIIDRLT